MKVFFNIRFSTSYGQNLYAAGNFNADGNTEKVQLKWLNDQFWSGSIDINDNREVTPIHYHYVLVNEDGSQVVEGERRRMIVPSGKNLTLVDTWNHEGLPGNVFYTQPFLEVLHKPNPGTPGKELKKYTHEFRVKAPLLKKDEVVCICGEGKELKNWNTEKVLPMYLQGEWFTLRLNLGEESLPLKYKYGIYNTKKKHLVSFESGDNRSLHNTLADTITIIHDGFTHDNIHWKGAGVAIPVFSLRSASSFGVGEFNDIQLLVDWAVTVGLKMVQILPVNDTTATHYFSDSYPYAAISAFALNPLYINLADVAGKKGSSLVKKLQEKQKELNALAEYDYVEVMKHKLAALRDMFQAGKEGLKKDKDYLIFYEDNKKWLRPYAVFCYLRDKYETSDFTQWPQHNRYNEVEVLDIATSADKEFDDIGFHYFVQYHLHLQLKKTVDYAHSKGVILKGDIPIGIYRYGADAWIDSSQYHMDQQAGAPPDDFAVKGQNWGFPTYNWERMAEDGFSWWQSRFEQMSRYFDAFRIDHILGFFRIWSIPLHAVEGIMGRFIPAIPMHRSEFLAKGIYFDTDRYCNPYITDSILEAKFSDTERVKETFLISQGNGRYSFKKEFNTQRRIEEHFKYHPLDMDELRQGLFDLVSNVILFEDASASFVEHYHFRFNMEQTESFAHLDAATQQQLKQLYVNYFFERQDEFWKKEALLKLPELKRSTNMMICGEDLGLVPACVPDVMQELGILSLEIQRMPKDPQTEFFHPKNAPYLSVVTPSTHDMSTIRGWWEEDKEKIQRFYNNALGHYGEAPYYCEPWINQEIVVQHLYSPAMWAIFQLQDILGMSGTLRRENPADERINQPADPNHYWRYRMHLTLEDLVEEKEFNDSFKDLIIRSGRAE